MTNRRVIFGIALFIVSGLLVYSFAFSDNNTPSNGQQGGNIEQNEQTNNEQTNNEQNQQENTNDNETATNETTTGSVVRNEPSTPSSPAVSVNYEALEKVVEESANIINDETIKEYLGDTYNELVNVVNGGNEILTTRNSDQASVDTQTNLINNILEQITNEIDNGLQEKMSEATQLLNNATRRSNQTLNNLLSQLENEVNDQDLTSKTLPQRVAKINSVTNLMNQVTDLDSKLEIIENSNITLVKTPDNWTNNDVVLTLDTEENVEQELELTYSFFKKEKENLVNLNDNQRSITILENGEYGVQINYLGEVVRTITETIENIDKNAPKFDHPSSEYFDSDVNIIINEVNLEKVEVCNQDTGETTIYTTNEFTLTDEATYKITAYDKAGNSDYIWLAIDKTAPTISNNGTSSLNGVITKENVKLNVFDKFLTKVVVNGEEFTRDNFEQQGKNENWPFVKELSEEGKYTVVAYDKFGNSTQVSFTIDKTAPVARINVIPAKQVAGLFGKEVLIIGEVDSSEENIRSHWFEITNPDGSKSYAHNLNTNALSYSFNLDTTKGSGTYIIRYVATDIAGNRSDDPGFSNPTVVTVNVDSTDPQTTINVSEVYQGKFTVSGLATDNYKLNRVYVQLVSRVTGERCGGTTINLLKPEQTTANWSLQYDVNDLGENCPDGYYAAHASVVDDLGNSGDTGWTENFLVDGTAPDIVLDESNDVSVEYNSTYNNFGYSATDNIDGDLTDKVEVEIRFQEQGGKWEDREFYSDKLGLYEIYYRVTDSQGNETKIFRKVEIVDTKKPEVKVNLNRQSYINSGDIISTRDIPEYEARDENLEKIIIYKENGEVKNTIIVENSIKRLGKMTHLNNGKYYIVAYDKAGNESEPFYFTIDNTAPTVTMSSITDNSYINTNNVKINIKAEDNIGLSKLVINLYKKEKDESFLFKSYSAILNGVLEYNCEHDFSYLDLEDGSYYVKINAKDKTGKTSNTIVRNFVIDTEAPVLAVKSKGNYVYDYGKSNYVERGATANDAIDGEVEVKIEGTVNDKVAGIHTITYTAVDKAGNEAKYERTIVIRPLVIAPDDFTHEVGNEFVAPKGTVIISENNKFEIDPNNYRWNPNQLGEYKLEYRYVLKIGDREISSLGKKTMVTVVDTTNPDVTYGKPEITKNYKESCLFGICSSIFTNADVNVNVNVEDNGEIVELKYIWLPSWKIIDNVVWKTEKLWDKAHDFENNSVITTNFKKFELLSNWKLWVYAKDASGNVQISSSEKIELVNL